jgi:Na+-driven multidrug efflux pump
MLFLSAVGFVFVVFPAPLVAAFTSDPSVAANAVRGLRIISSGFPFYAYAMVLTNSFNGAGDAMTPTIINLFCFWPLEIPIAYALSGAAGLGPSGVYWSIPIAYSTMAVVSVAVFRRGRWKLTKV